MTHATHKNIDYHLWMYDYKITKNIVFVKRGDGWVRTQTAFKELITNREHAALVDAGRTKTLATDEVVGPIIARHIKTNKPQKFASISAALKRGYTLKGITECIHGKARTHLKHTWELAV